MARPPVAMVEMNRSTRPPRRDAATMPANRLRTSVNTNAPPASHSVGTIRAETTDVTETL